MPCDWVDKSSQHPTLLCRSSEATASTCSAEQPAHTFHYQHIHQQDIITARDAQLFLATELDAWQALPHPRARLFIDMAISVRGRAQDGRPFFFEAFLNGFSWGRDIVLQVKRFYLVWPTDMESHGFWHSLQDGTTASIRGGDNARNCTVHSGACSISWL